MGYLTNYVLVEGLIRRTIYEQVKGDGPPSEPFSMVLKASAHAEKYLDRAREYVRARMMREHGLLVTINRVDVVLGEADPDPDAFECIERHEFDWNAQWYTQKIVAIDVETTGFDLDKDRITEVGWAKYNPKTKKFGAPKAQVIDPETSIPQELIERQIGPKPDELDGAPTFCEFAEELAEELDGAIMVIQNRGFDTGFLQKAFNRCAHINFTLGPSACTKEIAKHLGWDYETKLEKLAEHYGIELFNYHRAGHDAKCCGDLFLAMARWMIREDKWSKNMTLRGFVGFFDTQRWPNDD